MNASTLLRTSALVLTTLALVAGESNAQSLVGTYNPVYYPTTAAYSYPASYTTPAYTAPTYAAPTYYGGVAASTVVPSYGYGTVPSATYWNPVVPTQPTLLINPQLSSYQSWYGNNSWNGNSGWNNSSNNWWREEQLRLEREREWNRHHNQFGHAGGLNFR